MPAEGMMFVGDKGKILSGFQLENPEIIAGKSTGEKSKTEPPDNSPERYIPKKFIESCLNKTQCAGSFRDAWPITEAVNLYGVALRTGKTLFYDAATATITNLPEATKYLTREYRSGFEPASI
jgi:hypothetical protein